MTDYVHIITFLTPTERVSLAVIARQLSAGIYALFHVCSRD